MQNIFSAKLSKFSKLLTGALTVMIILITYIVLSGNKIIPVNQLIYPMNYIILIFLLIVFLLAYLLHPVRYIVQENQLNIVKRIMPISIPINSILEIKEITYRDIFISMRLFGSGGFCGYFGLYYSKSYGKVNMEASKLKNLILILTKNKKKYIISPDKPGEFVDTIISLK